MSNFADDEYHDPPPAQEEDDSGEPPSRPPPADSFSPVPVLIPDFPSATLLEETNRLQSKAHSVTVLVSILY